MVTRVNDWTLDPQEINTQENGEHSSAFGNGKKAGKQERLNGIHGTYIFVIILRSRLVIVRMLAKNAEKPNLLVRGC